MRLRSSILAAIIVIISGCKSIEGTYLPACIAFEGNKVTLSEGEYRWEKFTDQVVVDDDGNVVNQFPGYPQQGTYVVNDRTVRLTAAGTHTVTTLHLHSDANRVMLLTAEEYDRWRQNERIDACVLTRSGDTMQ